MILILNCGSQSIKWKVFDKKLRLKKQGKREVFTKPGFKIALKKELRSIKQDIDLIGHRVVHGGDVFKKPIKITKDVLRILPDFNKLAPLHNPYNLLGIKESLKVFPKVKQIAVFDTEFYADLPLVSSLYPIPGGYKRYGFHGISHEYAVKKISKPRIISCHLGGGCSITAVKNGKPIDTSMGFTPLEGLMMMTRPGDLDAGIVLDLAKKHTLRGVNKMLNYKSGMKAISGDSEMLKILKRKDKKAKLALDMFCYRVRKYIGAYYAVLGGCDVLVFTGTIGAGLAKTRNLILKDLGILKKTKIKVVKPDEELAIAEKIV